MNMGIVSGVRLYATLGVVALFAVVLGWGLRVNSLRAHYHGIADSAVQSLATAGFKNPQMDHISADIAALDRDRRTAHDNWAAADATVNRQSQTITDLHHTSELLGQQADTNRKIADAAIAARQSWIDEAKKAETRTEKQSTDAELAECVYAMDSLYRQGF